MDSETDDVTGLSGAWRTRTVSWPHVESDTQTRDEKRSAYVETPSCDRRHLCALLSREGKNRSETLSVLHVLTIAPTWVIGCWVGPLFCRPVYWDMLYSVLHTHSTLFNDFILRLLV